MDTAAATNPGCACARRDTPGRTAKTAHLLHPCRYSKSGPVTLRAVPTAFARTETASAKLGTSEPPVPQKSRLPVRITATAVASASTESARATTGGKGRNASCNSSLPARPPQSPAVQARLPVGARRRAQRPAAAALRRSPASAALWPKPATRSAVRTAVVPGMGAATRCAACAFARCSTRGSFARRRSAPGVGNRKSGVSQKVTGSLARRRGTRARDGGCATARASASAQRATPGTTAACGTAPSTAAPTAPAPPRPRRAAAKQAGRGRTAAIRTAKTGAVARGSAYSR
mmetsp:Transcript_25841/g.65149  ORF Transcript_25841/g.65149 Transcript_25841/m.65149 type:complete len:290 (+) Transcript_25841:2741-3610(+)